MLTLATASVILTPTPFFTKLVTIPGSVVTLTYYVIESIFCPPYLFICALCPLLGPLLTAGNIPSLPPLLLMTFLLIPYGTVLYGTESSNQQIHLPVLQLLQDLAKVL